MKRSIYFVTNGLSGGGAERVMSLIANELDNKGYVVSFIMLKKYPEAYHLNSGIKKYYKKSEKPKDLLGDIAFIKSFARNEENAVFVSFFTRQSLCTIIAALGTNNSVVVSERNDPQITVSSKLENCIRSLLYASKKCKCIVFQTNGAKKYFNDKIQNKGIIILNPIKSDLPLHDPEKQEKKIVAVGRLNKQKNYPLLLQSFAEFEKQVDGYKLHIYGKGDLENDLKELSRKLKIDKDVVFEGFCKDVHSEIVNATMFVMSSDYEGLSNALLVAMAMGLPCICTDSTPGGARMVIDDGRSGLLVPIRDVKSLSDAMVKISQNKEYASKLGSKAREIRERTCEENICQEWMAVFNSCFQ